MANHKHEFACMDRMIEFYKWLFEVNDKEEAREKVSVEWEDGERGSGRLEE